jgi:hypothetical protein
MAARLRSVRMNITLPLDVADWLDTVAENSNLTRSGYIMRMILERKGAAEPSRRSPKWTGKDWRPIDAAK